jgi:ribonucleoside-triphosphate reductase
MTSVKPSGTVSLLAGVTSGVHWPIGKYMVRRMRLSKYSSLVEPLREAGYPIEPCFGDDSSVVVEFPVEYGGKLRSRSEVSLWEKLALAAYMQRYWADNQVSVTIDFDPASEANQIEPALNYYQYQLKAVSFLPRREAVYPQMPEEVVTHEEFTRRSTSLRAVEFNTQSERADAERFCSGDTCLLAK